MSWKVGADKSKLLREMNKSVRKKDFPFVPTPKMIYVWYDVINKEVFEGKLPRINQVEVRRRHGCWAEIEAYEMPDSVNGFILSMNNKLWSKRHFLRVLAHEMVHIYEWINYGRMTHHTESFTKWVEPLAKLGIKLEVIPKKVVEGEECS